MLKVLFYSALLFTGMINCNETRSVKYGFQKHDTIPSHIGFDSLYKEVPFTSNCKDSVKLYEQKINLLIATTLNDLNMSKTYADSEKIEFIGVLKIYQSEYKQHLILKRKLHYLSYGSIPREKGETSCEYYLFLLKKEYFEISAIVDNVYHNIMAY